MVFLKLFQTAPSLPIETLIEHLDTLQSRLRSGQQVSNSMPPESHRAQGPVIMSVEPKVDAPRVVSSVDANRPQQDMDGLWHKIVGRISESKPSLAGFLTKCHLKSGDEGQLDLEVNGNEFILKNITKHKQTIEEQCRSIMERPVKLNINANFQDHATKQEQKKKVSHLKQEAVSHPLVLEAMELFDGRVIDIQVSKEE
jgi:DNA polymerase-3 subunit gamma/tau